MASRLRPPGLGPIVGHTTEITAHIWVRADDQIKDPYEARTRTLAVLGVFKESGKRQNPVPCFYFRLQREFARTGRIVLGHEKVRWRGKRYPLKPNSRYEVRIGILVLDDPAPMFDGMSDDELIGRLPDPEAWIGDLRALPDDQCAAALRTFPAEAKDGGKLDFLLGSCRYPGLLWKVRHSDRIFAPMTRLVSRTDGPRFMLMVGDQIYADALSRYLPLVRADTYEEFQERYITAYSSANLRNLMSRTPTYMILDDHEIEDNWSQDRIRRDSKHMLFTLAIDAYLSYQWSHGPRSFGKRLYYNFDYGGFPFFVIDTRTQRYYEGEPGDLSDNHLLGRPTLPGAPPGQLKRLLDWLINQQARRGNAPKFIVSPTVFVPNPMSARQDASDKKKEQSDSWPGFPLTRTALLRCIVDNNVQNVVFLSGDIHCANVARLEFAGSDAAKKLKAYSVTSSAFYWPFPFADGEPSDYVHNSRDPDQKDTFEFSDSADRTISVDYTAGSFTQIDNFCRLNVDRASNSLRVRTYDRKGDVIRQENDKGNDRKLDTRLALEPW